MPKTNPGQSPAVTAEEHVFFKIRSKETGLFKKAGVPSSREQRAWRSKTAPPPGWSKQGKIWDRKALAGHLALFKRENRIANGGDLPRPDLPKGESYYAIPEEYEILRFSMEGAVVSLTSVLPRGAIVSPNKE